MSDILYHAGKFSAAGDCGERCPICGEPTNGYEHLEAQGDTLTLFYSCGRCGHNYAVPFQCTGFIPKNDVPAPTYSVIVGPAIGDDPTDVDEFDDELEARAHFADIVRMIVCRGPAYSGAARVGLVRESSWGVDLLAEYVDHERGRSDS